MNRRTRDFVKASQYGINIPEEFKASMLKEGAGLNDQGLQNLTALLQGRDNSADHVAATLAKMDIRSDRLTAFVEGEQPVRHSENYLAQDEEHHSDGSEGGDTPEDIAEDELILSELAGLDFSEDQAALVFAIMENRMPRRRRTWKENKKFKAELRKDRSSFTKGHAADARPSGGRAPTPRDGGHRSGSSKDQLRRLSRCHNCGRRGHWKDECPGLKSSGEREKGGPTQGFCYLGGSLQGACSSQGPDYFVLGNHSATASHFSFAIWLGEEVALADREKAWSFLAIPSGMAILDIGATQDIVGATSMRALEEELARSGLQAIEVPTTAGAPAGIGGSAKVVRTMLVPISPGGTPGVVQFVVIENNVPPLLSVGLLEHLGARLDLLSNQVSFRKIGVDMKMTNLPTGHRAIPLVQWPGGLFPVPQAAKEQYGLKEDAFMKKDTDLSAYIKGSRAPLRGITPRVSQGRTSPLINEPNICHAYRPCSSLPDRREESVRESRKQPSAHQHQPAVVDDVKKQSSSCRRRVHWEDHASPMTQCSGSIAPMGNATASGRPKFDTSPRCRDHGTPSSDGGGGEDDQRLSQQMEAANRPHAVPLRGHPDSLLQAGRAREQGQEHHVREAQIPGGRLPSAGVMLAPSTAHSSSQPVCQLDSVCKVRRSADLRVQAKPFGEEQGAGQGAPSYTTWGHEPGPTPAERRELHATETDEFYGSQVQPGHDACRSGAPRAERDSAGHGHLLPERGRGAAGAVEGTEPDAADDAAGPNVSWTT